ncbi:hypothetical protein KCP77_23080 [Salmonella enterica subsp. enterica]|nr:hypothetical protein KCP77_23080 [Salmonella enterica subsp. enterica]
MVFLFAKSKAGMPDVVVNDNKSKINVSNLQEKESEVQANNGLRRGASVGNGIKLMPPRAGFGS